MDLINLRNLSAKTCITSWEEFQNIRAAIRLTSSDPNLTSPDLMAELSEYEVDQINTWIANNITPDRDLTQVKWVAHRLQDVAGFVKDYFDPHSFGLTLRPTPNEVAFNVRFGTNWTTEYPASFQETSYVRDRTMALQDVLVKHNLPVSNSTFFRRFAPHRSAEDFLNQNYLEHSLVSGTYIMFDERPVILAEGEEISPDLAPRKFRDYPGFTKTLIPLGDVPHAVALYQDQYHRFIVIPCDFYKMFDYTMASSVLKNTYKVLMYKLTNGIDATLSDPELLKRRVKDNIVAGLTAYYKNGLKYKEQELNNTITSRDDTGTTYNTLVQKVKLLAYELEGLRNNSKELDEITKTAQEEIDDIFKINKVQKVEYANERIIFTTNFLHFHNPDTNVIHQLGQLEVTANLKDFSLSFKNKTMRFRGSYDHPHILKGNICYGNFGIGLPELIQQGRLSVFIDMIIAFLETCNPKDEWGSMSIYWPIKDETGATPHWPDLKATRHHEYIMKNVVEPAKPVTDDDLLDKHNAEIAAKKNPKPKVKAPTPMPDMVTEATPAYPETNYHAEENIEGLGETEDNDDYPDTEEDYDAGPDDGWLDDTEHG